MVRIQYDVRRLWRCPKCQYERRADADKTAIRCHCDSDGPFMHLVEQQRQVRPEPEELPPYFEYDENDAAEEEANAEANSEVKKKRKKNSAKRSRKKKEPETTTETVQNDAQSETSESQS